jgi:hypothetical protein
VRATLVHALALILLAGCGAAPVADPRPVAVPFRDCLYTYYEQRANGERPDQDLLERRAKAGGLLIAALERAGVHVSEAQAREGLAGLVPAVERFLHGQTDDVLAVLEPPAAAAPGGARRANDWPGSFMVLDGVERRPDCEAVRGARRVRFHAIVYERALVLSYERWRGRGVLSPVDVAGDVVYLERRGASDAEVSRLLEDAALGGR